MTVQSAVARFRAALRAWDAGGLFTDEDYASLQTLLSSALRRSPDRDDLLDGLTGVFFERQLMNDRRRAELLAMDDGELIRAIRTRFRQLLADEQDEYEPYHALKMHVRQLLPSLQSQPTPKVEAPWPLALKEKGRFVQERVREALLALWAQLQRLPDARTATGELFRRYASADLDVRESQDPPHALQRRLDGQRLAEGILALLSSDERSLLRHLLVEEGNVEEWATAKGCSRATAYRHMASLKALCRLEFSARSNGTQLEALAALVGRL